MKINLCFLICTIAFNSIFSQTGNLLKVYASYRNTTLEKGTAHGDIIRDEAVNNSISFKSTDPTLNLTTEQFQQFSALNIAGRDSIFTSQNDKEEIPYKGKIKLKELRKLLKLFNASSLQPKKGMKVYNSPYEIVVEIQVDGQSIKVEKRDNPNDYANDWYPNGKAVFNPAIDKILKKVLPTEFFGKNVWLKIPSSKKLISHKIELQAIGTSFLNAIQSQDQQQIDVFIESISHNFHSVQFMQQKKWNYRGMPKSFDGKSKEEINQALQQYNSFYKKQIDAFIQLIKDKASLSITKTESKIGFFDQTGNHQVRIPRNAMEGAQLRIQLRDNQKKYKFDFGELYWINDRWVSFTDPKF